MIVTIEMILYRGKFGFVCIDSIVLQLNQISPFNTIVKLIISLSNHLKPVTIATLVCFVNLTSNKALCKLGLSPTFHLNKPENCLALISQIEIRASIIIYFADMLVC